jgi:hypothetical protein
MAHDLAAQWAPVLGCAWLLVQIIDKLIRLAYRAPENQPDGGDK